MRMNDEKTFDTKDFYIASFLLANGHRLSHVNRDDPQRVRFVFNDFEGRGDLLRDFLMGGATVEPQSFINSMKSLKQVIHSHD